MGRLHYNSGSNGGPGPGRVSSTQALFPICTERANNNNNNNNRCLFPENDKRALRGNHNKKGNTPHKCIGWVVGMIQKEGDEIGVYK